MSSTKRKSYSVEYKLSIINKFDNGQSMHSLEKSEGISRKMIRSWVKQRHEFIEATQKQKRKRVNPGGRKAKFPVLEKQLYRWFHKQRTGEILPHGEDSLSENSDDEEVDLVPIKHSVSYKNLREKAKEIRDKMGIPEHDLQVSDKWIFKFCRRHKLASRRYTHRGQADSRQPKEIAKITHDYLESLKAHTSPFSSDHIFNMDETPCYFDMCSERTISFRGEKNVDGTDTGHRKSRFSAVLTVSASGRVVKCMIIFKGLKKVPLLKLPKTISVAVSHGGSMNTNLMKLWIDSCFKTRGPYFARTETLLFMDSYGSHLKQEVLDYLKLKTDSTAVIIPPKTTHFLQPLDVCVNYPCKTALREHWEAWLRSGPKEYTPEGYRKRPSYQTIIDMVSLALDALKPEVIKNSFICCGIAEKGASVAEASLNHNLRAALSYMDKGITINEVAGTDINPFQGLEDEDDELGSDSEDIVEVEVDEANDVNESGEESDSDND